MSISSKAEQLLSLDKPAGVLQPGWSNPFHAEGTGLRLYTNMIFDEFLERYRDQIVTIVNVAGYAELDCKRPRGKGSCKGKDYTALNGKRHITDMIWHIDPEHWMKQSITAIRGVSEIPTGIAYKPSCAMQCMEHLPEELYRVDRDALEAEADGRANVNSTATTTALDNALGQQKEEFWKTLDSMNSGNNIHWIDGSCSDTAREVVVLISGKLVYHCKRPDTNHSKRDRKRWRLDISPSMQTAESIQRATYNARMDRKCNPNTAFS